MCGMLLGPPPFRQGRGGCCPLPQPFLAWKCLLLAVRRQSLQLLPGCTTLLSPSWIPLGALLTLLRQRDSRCTMWGDGEAPTHQVTQLARHACAPSASLSKGGRHRLSPPSQAEARALQHVWLNEASAKRRQVPLPSRQSLGAGGSCAAAPSPGATHRLLVMMPPPHSSRMCGHFHAACSQLLPLCLSACCTQKAAHAAAAARQTATCFAW